MAGYFQPGPHRATQVHTLFERIAHRYDLINDVQSFGLHRYWKRKVIALAKPGPGQRALDICCGTGDIAFALAGCRADVTGLDFSERMLAVARARSEAHREPHRPGFITGDAQSLPFPENSFDIVTVGYGLRNLADWEAGLREMVRVAKPNGTMIVLEFGRPQNSLWRWLYFTYLRLFVPILGLVFCGSLKAYSYILESLMHYPGQIAVAAKMSELNLVGVKMINLLGGAMSINYGRKPAPL